MLAVDIGRSGAFALFAGSELVAVDDMPVLADGPAGRPTINGPLLAALGENVSEAKAWCERIAGLHPEKPGDRRSEGDAP